MDIRVVKATPQHIDHINNHARQADIDEFEALSLSTPKDIMVTALRVSNKAWTIMLEGKPVAMFGVAGRGLLSNTGVPWLVGTHDLEMFQKAFLRGCKSYIQEMASGYNKLENYVDARNFRAITWLRWLGFTIEKPKPYGVLQKPFHHFYLEKRL